MQQVITLREPIGIFAYAAIGGKEEAEGPLGDLLDHSDLSDRFGQKTWELAQSELSHEVLSLALKRANLLTPD